MRPFLPAYRAPRQHKVRAVMDMKIRYGPLCLLSALGVLFLAESTSIRAATTEALALCAASVIPALFPFLVVSSLLLSCGLGEWAAVHLAGFMTPLFRLPGCAASALLLGLVGGYPVGVRTAAQLYRQGSLTKNEASRLLTFCNNASPVFLISVLGQGVFGSFSAGLWLWLVHLSSALLTGLLFRRTEARDPAVPRVGEVRAVHLPSAFVRAVTESTSAMISICGFVTLFYVLSRPLAALGGSVGAALTGGVELFSLTPLLKADGVGFVLASACTAWGGVSLHCQSAAVLEGSGLSARWCLIGKAVQGLFAAALAALVWGRI